MSREIVFRGKRVDNGEWVEGLLTFKNEIRVFTTHKWYDDGEEGDYDTTEDLRVIPETVGQYTGLTDKNGKKIFEGDIVMYSDEECYYPGEYTEFMGVIVFEKGAFGIGCREELPIDLDYWCDNDNFVSLWELYWNLNCTQDELPMLEVIGNIYDNHELLEVEK